MSIAELAAEADEAFVDSPVARLFEPLDEQAASSVTALMRELRRPRPVNGGPAPGLVDRFRGTSVPDVGWDLARYLETVRSDIVAHSVSTASPRCLAHMTPPVPGPMPLLASLVASLNQNLVRVDASVALSLCERQVLAILHRLVFDRSAGFYTRHAQRSGSTLGTLVSGGTLANITAMWCARNAAFPDGTVRRLGLAGALAAAHRTAAVVVGPASMHYSFAKAADLLGMGRAGLVKVPLDEQDVMSLPALRRTLRRCAEQGRQVVAVVGVAGTTNSGAVDPLEAIADLAEETGCHFHVDAAWGGPLLMSRTHAGRLAGIERADTVTLDGHKQLYLPVGSGVLLFRNPAAARHLEHAAAYTVRPRSADLGLRSPEGSRPGNALLLHAALHLLGRRGYEDLVDLGLRQAGSFAAAVRAHPRFRLLRDPQLNIVLYRYVPEDDTGRWTPASLDRLNVAIQRAQRQAGAALVSRTTTTTGRRRQVVALRAVLANPFTTSRDIDAVLTEQAHLGWRLEHGLLDVAEGPD